MLIYDLTKSYPSHRLNDRSGEVSSLQQFPDVRVFLPRGVLMPIIVLDALEGEEDVCSPDAIPERKSKDDGGVEVLVSVAAIKGTPVSGVHLADTEVLLCWNKMFDVLVDAEQDLPVCR